MPEPLLALGALIAAAGAVWVWLALRTHGVRRAGALDLMMAHRTSGAEALVLAFTTPDCIPCKTVQRPALEALERQFPGRVVSREVDALDVPDLARRFGILTVPSTVVIGANGEVRAINHGTATADRLAAQAGLDVNGARPE